MKKVRACGDVISTLAFSPTPDFPEFLPRPELTRTQVHTRVLWIEKRRRSSLQAQCWPHVAPQGALFSCWCAEEVFHCAAGAHRFRHEQTGEKLGGHEVDWSGVRRSSAVRGSSENGSFPKAAQIFLTSSIICLPVSVLLVSGRLWEETDPPSRCLTSFRCYHQIHLVSIKTQRNKYVC